MRISRVLKFVDEDERVCGDQCAADMRIGSEQELGEPESIKTKVREDDCPGRNCVAHQR